MGRGRGKPANSAAGSKPLRRPLALHPLFGAVLGLWGAALGGLVVLVLPRNLLLEAAAQARLAAIGAKAPLALAALAALVLGGAMLAIAGLITRRTSRRVKDTTSLAATPLHRVQTIDPANDLGSRCLDDPIEAVPFSELKPAFAAEAEAEAEAETRVSGEIPPPPLELDLAAFAALPGRNAVWVEDRSDREAGRAAVAAPQAGAEVAAAADVPEAVAGPDARAATPAPHPLGASAIARLRAVPTSELSLVQMVERFAAALQEHQSIGPGASDHRADQARRDAALAEALRALAAFGPEAGAPVHSEPLRAALTRLRELRGAA
ncbi:hypothetical protein [Erythrobacter tepidarius]|uniref:hypothetical protein n=1 Tax=Erythrobacter tepidarius TaxID=60454 RepID=UPI00117E8664|nr:hypothetical protein [Erythrobacter tepidarius]